ncbi:MAG: hypothetical protein HFF50_09910 [Lawsonibacter sp.]|nr:hypothetical protein [Lawsonibacter sp.]
MDWFTCLILGGLAILCGGVLLCLHCLLFGRGRSRRQLAWLTLALGGVLLVQYGGGAVLARYGLGWRALPELFLTLAGGLLVPAVLAKSSRMIWELPGEEEAAAALGSLCGALAIVAVLGWGALGLLFGSWTDRVSEWEGQKVVLQDAGIFRITGYRYVNALVHGEELFTWKD